MYAFTQGIINFRWEKLTRKLLQPTWKSAASWSQAIAWHFFIKSVRTRKRPSIVNGRQSSFQFFTEAWKPTCCCKKAKLMNRAVYQNVLTDQLLQFSIKENGINWKTAESLHILVVMVMGWRVLPWVAFVFCQSAIKKHNFFLVPHKLKTFQETYSKCIICGLIGS